MHIDRPAVVGDSPVLLRRKDIGAKNIGGSPVSERIEKHGDRIVLDRAERVGLPGRDRVALRDRGREALDIGIERFEGHIQRRCGLADADHGPERRRLAIGGLDLHEVLIRNRGAGPLGIADLAVDRGRHGKRRHVEGAAA